MFLRKASTPIQTNRSAASVKDLYGSNTETPSLLELESSRKEEVFDVTNPICVIGGDNSLSISPPSGYAKETNGDDLPRTVSKNLQSNDSQETDPLTTSCGDCKANAAIRIQIVDVQTDQKLDRPVEGFPGTDSLEIKTVDLEKDNTIIKTDEHQVNETIGIKRDDLKSNKIKENITEGRSAIEPLNLSVHLESNDERIVHFEPSSNKFSPSRNVLQMSGGVIGEDVSSNSSSCSINECNQGSATFAHSKKPMIGDLFNILWQGSYAVKTHPKPDSLDSTKTTLNLSSVHVENDYDASEMQTDEQYSPSILSANDCISNEEKEVQTGTGDAINSPQKQDKLKKRMPSQATKVKLFRRNKLLNFAQKETESTKRVTVWSVGIFHRWMNKGKEMSKLPQLIKMTVPQINTYLCKFLVHARKIDGTRYPSKSLQALGQGLLRYVRNNRIYTHRECGSTEGVFKPVNQVLAMELRRTMYYEELAGRTPKVRQKRRSLPTKYISVSDISQKPLEDQIIPDDVVTCSNQQSDSTDLTIEVDTHDSGVGTKFVCSELYNEPPQPKTVRRETQLSAPLQAAIHREKGTTHNTSPPRQKLLRKIPKETDDSQRNKSTEKNTRWAVHIFNKWRSFKQNQGSPSIPEIQDMSVEDVNSILVEFMTTVVKTDGSEYIPSCLYSLACGLLRYTRNHSRHELDFMNSKDERFAKFQTALSDKIKSLEPENTHERQKLLPLRRLTPSEEDRLWNYHVFGMETAKSLQYTVFYYNFKIFGIKSYAMHRNLQRCQFSVVGEDFVQALHFDSSQPHSNGESNADKGPGVKTFRNTGDDQDIVGLYEVYFEAVGNAGPFYKRLVGFQGPTLRFTEQNVGIRSLQSIWSDICEAVRLEKG